MNDDLENFKHILRQTPPPAPDVEKKKATLAKAMAAFDEKTTTTSQGTARAARQIGTAWAGFKNILRESVMMRTRLMAGTAVAALVVVVGVVSLQSEQGTAVMSRTGAPSNIGGAASPYFLEQTKNTQQEREKIALGTGGSVLPTPMGQNAGIDEMASASVASVPAVPSAKKDQLVQLRSEILHQQQEISQMKQQVPVMAPMKSAGMDASRFYCQDQGRDKFEPIKVNPIKLVKDDPVSTFSIDVDTSSYSFVRAELNQNVLPQKDAVRIEELVNYFPYDYEAPKDKDMPFKANVSVFPTPWNPATKLVHIGIKGYQIEAKEKPHSNLVFLIDTSGSMWMPNKLPLVQNALKMLLDTLKDDDTVGIVTYAGNAGIALEPTKVKDKLKIAQTIDNLTAWGSTAGAEGIRLAYQLAEKNFDKHSVNRVILATDGDFNVGITNQDELKSFIERERNTGVYLSVLGFGMGNYNDAMMQTLAQNGNGNAAYIDNINEARKALVEEAGSTLFTIAKDVKIQVEFNPATVSEYRLIGYENRLLNREDFNNDKVDAGEIGSGHTVTALYEITPVDSQAKLVDDLRYQKNAKPETADNGNGEYAFVKIRYKLPDSDTSKLITTPVDHGVEYDRLSEVPKESLFATSVAAFGQILRGDPYTKDYKYDDVIALAEQSKGPDKFGYRSEFINLIRLAKNAPALPTQQ